MKQLNLEEVVATQGLIQESMAQLVSEMAKTGGAVGGSGRLQSFAPALVHLSWASDVLENLRVSLTPAPEAKQNEALRKKG